MSTPNERFNNVYLEFIKTKVIVKGCRKKGKGKFAERLFGRKRPVHLIDRYRGTGEIVSRVTHEMARRLDKIWEVRVEYLLEGEGAMFSSKSKERPESNAAYFSGGAKGVVHLYNGISAQAGAAINSIENERFKLETFELPGISSRVYGFEVKGDSMHPKIAQGDYVLTKIESTTLSEIKNGEVYVVGVEDAIMVKRIFKVENQENTVRKIELRSDNSLFEPIFEDAINIRFAYQVMQKLQPMD